MSGRWRILLIASLVLNLFLAGAVAGGLVVGAKVLRERTEARRAEGQRMAAAFQVLAPERRTALREIMRDQARSAAPDMREAREARREAMRLIAADPYDPKAVTAALDRAREAEDRARARIDATLAARLAELQPQERATFAGRLMFGPGRGERRMMILRGRPGGPPPPPPPEGAEAPEAN